MEQFYFKSTLFEIEPNEDDETNPRIYGKQFANWLTDKLSQVGYQNLECFPEDWGWCIIIFRNPFKLFIACSNVYDYETAVKDDPPPQKENIIWSCFISTEVPFYKRILNKIYTSFEKNKLENEVESILKTESSIQLVEEP